MNTNIRLEELESLLLAPLCSLLGEVQRLLDMTVVEQQTAEQEEQQDETVARSASAATLSQQVAPPLATAFATANRVGSPADSYAVSPAIRSADRSVHAPPVFAANREQAPETQATLSSAATPREGPVSAGQSVEPATEPPSAFRATVQPRRPSITPANAKTKLESHPVITLAPISSSGSAGSVGSRESVVKSASHSEQVSSPAENRTLPYSSPYPVSTPAISDHGASGISPAPHKPPQTVDPWGDRPEPFPGSAYPPISRLPGIPLVSRALQQTAGRVLTGLEPTLERAYQLSQSALNPVPPQPERITPSGPVNNTFNVSVTLTPQQAVTALDQEALQDALVEMLRAAARRHGLEL